MIKDVLFAILHLLVTVALIRTFPEVYLGPWWWAPLAYLLIGLNLVGFFLSILSILFKDYEE